jgi:hypothetical protein
MAATAWCFSSTGRLAEHFEALVKKAVTDRWALGSVGVTTPDSRIVLRGDQTGLANDPIMDHPGQPADYIHADGTVWTWQERWRIVDGVHLRMYDLVEPDDLTGSE